MSPKSKPQEAFYEIIHHGGIGDGEKQNLSGSCHELKVTVQGKVTRILVDMGLYQGSGGLDRDMGTVCKGVDAVIFTHPHIDHIGEALELTKQGFPKHILARTGTKQAMKTALLDSVGIAVVDYYEKKRAFDNYVAHVIRPAIQFVRKFEAKGKGVKKVDRGRGGNRMNTSDFDREKNTRYQTMLAVLEKNNIDAYDKDWFKKLTPPEAPRFSEEDVRTLMENISTHSITKGWKNIAPNIDVRFYNAGHILGSASPCFRITHDAKPHYVLFTGDIGSYKWDIHPTGIPNPPNNLPLDAVVIESTYGGRVRKPFMDDLQHYESRLSSAMKRYDQVIHACFTMSRFQDILFRVIDMKKRGLIDENIPVYIDSVMGSKYIPFFVRQAKRLDDKKITIKQRVLREIMGNDYEAREQAGLDKFGEYLEPGRGEYIVLDKESRDYFLSLPGKRIIITSSGMAEGGPIMTYLDRYASDAKTAFYFPGFLVPGTRGYKIAADRPEGQDKVVELEKGVRREIKARMVQIPGFSGHGDEEDLLNYLRGVTLRDSSKIIIVHGDIKRSSQSFANTLEREGYSEENIIIGQMGTSFRKDL